MTHRTKAAIVPAAGLGTRMKSSTPKFLHTISGRTIITHIALALEDVVDRIVFVVGTGREDVEREILESCSHFIERIAFVEQKQLLGSGHATQTGLSVLKEEVDDIFVVLGDMPLLTSEVLNEMYTTFIDNDADVLVSTAILENPFGYGRIIRDENKIVREIIEEKDCDDAQKKIHECNMYPFIFTRRFLESALDKLDTNNAQGEQYLTDVVSIARQSSNAVASYTYSNPDLSKGVNNRCQLSELENIMRESINNEHMDNGVTMIDPQSIYIDASVIIAADVILLPGVILEGNTTIASGSKLGPNTRIVNSTIGENCVVESSTIKGSILEDDITIGPYASLRPGTHLRNGVHVGSFVEMKKADIGERTKVPHLSYLGDATVGENTNLGAGTITANYDGKNKHTTTIGSRVKTGVNTVFVAPVEVGDEAYTAAGAVVTKDVPEGTLVKGVPAEIVDDWVPPAER